MKIIQEFKLEITLEDEHLTIAQRKRLEQAITPLSLKRVLLDAFGTKELILDDNKALKLKITKIS